jgi:hypothetical protein
MTNQTDDSKGGLAGTGITVALLLLAYVGAYCTCVRSPRVAFTCMSWPYYAVHPVWGRSDYRLPPELADPFFYPANWVHRRLDPKKWPAEKFTFKTVTR